mgnify:CR=1 FL=1
MLNNLTAQQALSLFATMLRAERTTCPLSHRAVIVQGPDDDRFSVCTLHFARVHELDIVHASTLHAMLAR